MNTPQPEEQFTQQAVEQKENIITPQLEEQIRHDIFSIGWGHHKLLIDKYSKEPEKAFFCKVTKQRKQNKTNKTILCRDGKTSYITAPYRARAIYRAKKSATSATSDCNRLKLRILWVHIGFLKMLPEKLLARVSCYLHICVLLCRNETYRKVAT